MYLQVVVFQPIRQDSILISGSKYTLLSTTVTHLVLNMNNMCMPTYQHYANSIINIYQLFGHILYKKFIPMVYYYLYIY